MATQPSEPKERKTSLTDLPFDVLALVFPYLDARGFLALCATCRGFQQNIRLDAAYWRHTTRTNFRVPNRPAVESDGERWQRLYKRILTQSRVFTWGSNTHLCLGHDDDDRGTAAGANPVGRRPAARRRLGFSVSTWPVEVASCRDMGVIADLQCGGWSTTILNSKGTLFTFGIVDGMSPTRQNPVLPPTVLEFPPGYPKAGERDEPATAIRQFSSGRSHILGLSDSGRIWSWYDKTQPALQVKTLHVDFTENSTSGSSRSNVRKVVAGWNTSSAYVNGTGIVVWDPVRRGRDQQAQELDTMLVIETAVVPNTFYQRPKGLSREPDHQTRLIGEVVGEVTNYIVLESFVVFVTDIGKVFAAKMHFHNGSGLIRLPVELRDLHVTSPTDPTPSATDIQGAFRSFAVFKRDGSVLLADHDCLDDIYPAPGALSPPTLAERIKRHPALQNTGVTTLAFGDHHFHALHANGHITSYGTEPQSCGALGLGGDGDPEGRLRGIRYVGRTRDGQLLPQAYETGRRVWFEPEKRQWIRFMASGGRDPDEAKERLRLTVNDPVVQGEVSEWFEQEGRDWDSRPGILEGGEGEEDDGLGAYFVLNVAAAGWHSGALVLVNEGLASKVRESCIVPDPTTAIDEEQESSSSSSLPQGALASALSWLTNSARWFLGLPTRTDEATNPPPEQQPLPFTDPQMHGASPGRGLRYVWADDAFPRLRLKDGREMPGEVGFNEWRLGRPG